MVAVHTRSDVSDYEWNIFRGIVGTEVIVMCFHGLCRRFDRCRRGSHFVLQSLADAVGRRGIWGLRAGAGGVVDVGIRKPPTVGRVGRAIPGGRSQTRTRRTARNRRIRNRPLHQPSRLCLKKRRAAALSEKRSVPSCRLTRLIFSLFDLRLHKGKVLVHSRNYTTGPTPSTGFAFFRLAFFRPLPPVISTPKSE